MEERKKKRLERFGSAAPATNGSAKTVSIASDVTPVASKPGRIPITAPTSSAGSKSSMEDKKKLRAERFKSSAAVSAK